MILEWKDRRFTVSLTATEYDRLDILSDFYHLNKSALIRDLINEDYENVAEILKEKENINV